MNHSEHIVTGNKVLSGEERDAVIKLCNRILEGPGGLYIQRTRELRANRDFIERRNAMMILLILDLGLRASELLNLRVRDFSIDRGTLFINSLKASRPRELPLRPKRAQQLKTYTLEFFGKDFWRDLDREERFFPICYKQLERIWHRLRPTKKGIHSLRHTFAVDFLMRTDKPRALQLALGHKNYKSTEVYQDFIFRQKYMMSLMYDEQAPAIHGSGPVIDLYS